MASHGATATHAPLFFGSTNNMACEVYLHGNHIATVTDSEVILFDGGYQSNTTKSRLNAIINEFTDGTKNGVFQKNWTWFVTKNGEKEVFQNGVALAKS